MINDSRPLRASILEPPPSSVRQFLLARRTRRTTQGEGGEGVGILARRSGSKLGEWEGGGLLGTAVWTGIWDKNNGNLFPFSSGNENVSFLQPGDLFFSSSYWRFTRFDEVKARNSEVRRLEGSRIFLIAREEGGRTFLRFRNAFRYRFLFR